MKGRLAVVFVLLASGSMRFVPAATTRGLDTATMHIRMRAIILADNNNDNPPGVLTPKQLRQWIDKANETYRVSNARWVIDFDAAKDVAWVSDSCLNRLNHNQNERASRLAAQYPGVMVVYFRAYQGPGTGHPCSGHIGPNGNGYTAYNPYVPVGTSQCVDIHSPGCSASYVVMPSVYCASGVGVDFKGSRDPGPSVPTSGKDSSGCPIFVQPGTGLIFIQNFDQLAHELGHYFGLPHTFPGPSDLLTKPGSLQSWYDGPPRPGTTRSLEIFDGDSPTGPRQNGGYTGWAFRVSDTPADAGAQIYVSNGVNMCATPKGKTISDGSGAKVTFKGDSYTLEGKDQNHRPLSLTFKPDKGNLMSYFACENPLTLTKDQVKTMWSVTLNDPNRKYLVCDNANNAEIKRYIACP